MEPMTTRAWLDRGGTAAQLKAELSSGRLLKPRRGMLIDGDGTAADRHLARLYAAMPFIGTQTFFSHTSAAAIHRLPLLEQRHAETSVVRTGGGHGVVHPTLHARRAILAPDEQVVIAGLPVTSLARTVADLMRMLPFPEAVMIADVALARGLPRDALLGTTSAGRGCRMAAKALGFADPLAESPGESLSRVRFAEFGIPAPSLQQPLRGSDGRMVRVDFYWELFRLIGEFDGAIKYGALLKPGQKVEDVVAAEKRREQSLRELDYKLVRWTWAELWHPGLAERIWRAMGSAGVESHR